MNVRPEEGELSRRAEFERDNHPVEMPECTAFYLLDYLLELGVTLGDAAITHAELRSWMDNTGIDLNSWEVRSIKSLSEAYLSTTYEARAVDAETPWEDAPYYMSGKWRKAMRLKLSIRRAAEI